MIWCNYCKKQINVKKSEDLLDTLKEAKLLYIHQYLLGFILALPYRWLLVQRYEHSARYGE